MLNSLCFMIQAVIIQLQHYGAILRNRSFFVITSLFFAMPRNRKQTLPFHPIFASQRNDSRVSSPMVFGE